MILTYIKKQIWEKAAIIPAMESETKGGVSPINPESDQEKFIRQRVAYEAVLLESVLRQPEILSRYDGVPSDLKRRVAMGSLTAVMNFMDEIVTTAEISVAADISNQQQRLEFRQKVLREAMRFWEQEFSDPFPALIGNIRTTRLKGFLENLVHQ